MILVWATLTDAGAPELAHARDEIDALVELDRLGACRVVTKVDEPWENLTTTLLKAQPDFFHFIGHGDSDGTVRVNYAGELTMDVQVPHLLDLLGAAPRGGPTGVFLNACWSSSKAVNWQPHRGWLISVDRGIHDAPAFLCASRFYRNLLLPDTPPDVRIALRLAQESVKAELQSSSDMLHTCWIEVGGQDAEKHESAANFIRIVFNRGAFRLSAIEELALEDVQFALSHTAMALTTGRLVEREGLREIRQVSVTELQHPGVLEFVDSAIRALDRSQRSLAVLANAFPALGRFGYTPAAVPTRELERALTLMDDLDRRRNEVLGLVNRFVESHGLLQLQPIEISSSTRFAQYLRAQE